MIYPMFAMVLLTFGVSLLMLRSRVHAIRSGQMDFRYFKTFSAGEPSQEVLKTGRHFMNLFEVPVLFYAGCLAALQISFTGFWPQFWAWLFVGARLAHAIIHLGPNKLLPRMSAFIIGFGAVLALWIHLAVAYTMSH